MQELVRESIQKLKSYQPVENTMQVKLDANENPYNLFEQLGQEWFEYLKTVQLNRYPDSDSMDLRKALGEYTGFEKENIICGNGSDEIIQVILQTFIDKGEVVVTHSPTFSMYKVFTTIVGGEVIAVPSDEDFQIDVEGMIQTANEKKAKIIFLCNPNNPTGTVLEKERIVKILQETSAILVVDEAYFEFYGKTVADLVKDYPRLIVLRTLSKAFALAGLRIGYGIAHKEMMEILYRVKPPYNVNHLSQWIAQSMLKNRDSVQESIDKIIREREKLVNELEQIQNIKVFPSASNFILIQVDEVDQIIKECNQERIGVRGYQKDNGLKDFLRITVGTSDENTRLMNLIRKVVE